MIVRKKQRPPCASGHWLEFKERRERLADLITRRASRSANDTGHGVTEEDTNERRR